MEYSHCGTMYVLIIWNMEIVKQELHITFQKNIYPKEGRSCRGLV